VYIAVSEFGFHNTPEIAEISKSNYITSTCRRKERWRWKLSPLNRCLFHFDSLYNPPQVASFDVTNGVKRCNLVTSINSAMFRCRCFTVLILSVFREYIAQFSLSDLSRYHSMRQN